MELSKRICVVLSLVLLVSAVALAADWPQFRGPERDGTSPEAGLMKQWPAGGPKELWSYDELGEGYSSVSVADGTIYTCGKEGDQGYLYALDLDGNLKYRVHYGQAWNEKGNYPGTRTAPTVDGDRVYLMSGHGRLSCHDAATGKQLLYVDTLDKFNGRNIRWGIAESVLIDGRKVICTPGGRNATVVALDKMTGETIWTSKGLSQRSAYCSPLLIERGGTRLILTLVEKALAGIDADTGEVYWTVPHEVSYDIQAVSPVYHDGIVYITNGYRKGSHGFALSADGKNIEKKWSERSLDVHHGGVVLIDGDIHGASTRGEWMCLDIATGKVEFTDRSDGSDRLVGKGSVIYVDDRLYVYGEKGGVGLVRIKPDGYEMTGSFEIKKGSKEHWAHPAISDGRLYIRHGEVLMCYDIEAR